jgi:hypothetical protein
MDAVIEAELRAIADGARAQEESARKLAERVERLLSILEDNSKDRTKIDNKGENSPAVSLKREDGRLSDAGVAAVNAAFDSGESVTQIAKRFEIHVSAAANRRALWRAQREREAQARREKEFQEKA